MCRLPRQEEPVARARLNGPAGNGGIVGPVQDYGNASDADRGCVTACVVTPTRPSGRVCGLHSTIRDVSSQSQPRQTV